MASDKLKALDLLQRAIRLWPDKGSRGWQLMLEAERQLAADYRAQTYQHNPSRRMPHARAFRFNRAVKHPVHPYVVRLRGAGDEYNVFHSWHDTWVSARNEAKRLNKPGIRWG